MHALKSATYIYMYITVQSTYLVFPENSPYSEIDRECSFKNCTYTEGRNCLHEASCLRRNYLSIYLI